jgi:hypothetical protein
VSDHFSGPRAIAGPKGDICDLYAFPSPERPGQLILVMNVMPGAGPSDFFSDAVVCRFRLRPVSIVSQAASGGPWGLAVGAEETELACTFTFEAPRQGDGAALVQAGSCTPPSGEGEVLTFQVHDEQGRRGSGFRVFAGLRSEPFFVDLVATMETVNTGQLAFKEVGDPWALGWNVLSIVVEVDCATLLAPGGGHLFAVAAETVAAGKLPIRLERVGRPEVKNLVLSSKDHDPVNRDLEIRDLYNLEDPFHMGADYRGAYRARLDANLAFLDGLDAKRDWPLDPEGIHPLTELLLADHLIVDVSKPYAEDSFFEIERATLQGRAHATCGGRSLNDDVMDTLLTLLINAENGPRISDGVDQATVPASRIFPYLAPPNAPQPASANGRDHGRGSDDQA